MAVLFWLEGLRNPILDAIMLFFTYFGDEILFIILALTVFWCVDKREGYYLLFIGFFGTILNQFLKLLCRIPRPWVRNPKLTQVEGAVGGATGYSFPSGHTQNAIGTLGGIARWHQGKWLRIACIAVALLCALSRMYLGVHTPLDVGVSLLLATVLIFVFYPLVRWATEKPKRMYLLLGGMLLCAFAFVLYANCSKFPAEVNTDNLYEGRKNSYSLLGALLGFLLAYPLERRYVKFQEKAPLLTQCCKVVLGLILLLAIKEGMKIGFSAIGFTWLGSNALRYFAVVVFAALVWPLSFPLLTRLTGGRKRK